MINYLARFLYVLSQDRKQLLLLLSLFVVASVMEAFGVGLVGPFLWLASHPESLHKIFLLNWAYAIIGINEEQFILLLGLFLVIIFCIKSFLYFLARAYVYHFSVRQQGKLISRLLSAYLSVPYTFYLNRDTASLIKNILYETHNFCHRCMLPLLEATSNVIAIVLLLLLLAKADLLLLAMILIIIFPTFLLFYYLKNKSKKWGKEESESYHEMIRIINHSLGGVKETYVIGCQDYFKDQINIQTYKFADSSSKFTSFQLLPRVILETLLIIFLVIFISVYQIIFKQNIENIISVLSIFAAASIRLMPAVSQSLSAIGLLQAGSNAVDMLYADLKNVQENKIEKYQNIKQEPNLGNWLASKELNNQTISFSNGIELKNIAYYYPTSTRVAIDNISLTLKKGQSIGLIGKSGAGKTTLVDIILGLLESIDGDILVDGVSIYKNLRSWQNLIGYIPQSIFLTDDSIERNIAFGVPDHLIDYEKLDRAICATQLSELIQQLPEGVKTCVGERGIRLSGGQRQRIGIARALYHEREILVLDEATAALDNETESIVNESIRLLSGKKTMIIIAHRLTTLEYCDRIYVLEHGKIVNSGSYQEVVLGQVVSS